MIEFEVKNMTCEHCVETITRAVKETIPQATVHIDLRQHVVRIEGTSDTEAIHRVIREVGYTPTLKQ
ncbi:heavy-metal-associated domain-containing protein [Pusillimonas sp. ANT_WB101]|uniref:heavy-metal-associated domain-containing protein n=1 Tax=Pusillimonas sp. ANT_WB101 TaxID=2597356 RepID=UPI0011ED6A6C|nr:heavy-metal-associated domain-containing protein [Pusillimonas sp. ANT_WB101]KAA0911100.1 heavy-metal-associated domain-containing protein [Pusillimonas sp. ANT_WB101]